MGQPWTGEDIGRWLITGFREMPATPIYAPRGNTLRSADPNKPSATYDLIAFACTVLGARSAECRAVLVWARSKATRGEVGGSIQSFCDEVGWSRSTFEARRRRACQWVAQAKNLADGHD